MRQIATEIGLAVGGIYNHYQSKDAIFKALLQERSISPQLIDAINAIQGTDGPDMLRQALIASRHIARENTQFIGLVMIDMREFDGSTIRSLMGSMLPQFLRFVQRAMAAGGIRKEINLFVLLRSFVMTMLGYILTDLVDFPRGYETIPGTIVPDDEAWQNAIIDVYLSGIAHNEYGDDPI